MIGSDQTASDGTADPAAVIARHLQSEDEVIRCAAAKALGAVADRGAAPYLIGALLDEDPDVRTDAMEALVTCARPDDASAILRSLKGDPVKEVKIFAIKALARLEDDASSSLIRQLARDRAEDSVAWEDDAGMWDDWLDVQIAAIEALGDIQANDAIDDLLEARTDEMGQELDDVIFPAFARFEEGGVSALVGFLRDRDPRVRERAVKAMGEAHRGTLLPLRDILLNDASPAIRTIAIATVDPNSRIASDLVRHDRDPTVREAAVGRFAPDRPDLVRDALRDSDERVRTTALESLTAKSDETGDLAANLQAWMVMGGAVLAAKAASVLPDLIGAEAVPELVGLAEHEDRPLEARISAVRSLGKLSSQDIVEPLQRLAKHPVRQIRAAALTSLAGLSQREGPWLQAAEQIIAAAISGEIGKDLRALNAWQAAANGDVGASKVEQGPARIAISEDGEIIEIDDDQAETAGNVVVGSFPTSTLDAIQSGHRSSSTGQEELSSNDGSAAAPVLLATKRRRVPVDGPDDIASDIIVIAIGLAANCSSPVVDQALLEAMEAKMGANRADVLKAISQRPQSEKLADELIARSIEALRDPDPAIRGYAAAIVEQRSQNASRLLDAYLDDSDPWVRATALRSMPPERFKTMLNGLRDESALVRKTALETLANTSDNSMINQAIDVCLAEGRSDTLKVSLKHNPDLLPQVVSRLARNNVTKLEALTALQAIA